MAENGGEKGKEVTVIELSEEELQQRIQEAVGDALVHQAKVTEVLALTTPDGRYAEITHPQLEGVVTEHALMRNRFTVEVEWLKFLLSGRSTGSKKIESVSDEALKFLDSLIDNYTIEDTLRIKEIENGIKPDPEKGVEEVKGTQHDVKAVEYHLRELLSQNEELNERKEITHLALTSEDVNSISYAMIMRQTREIVIAKLQKIVSTLATKAFEWSDIPMVALTHGQPAVPQVLGKIMAVPATSVSHYIEKLQRIEETVKFGGAVGDMNSFYAADPDVDWESETTEFTKSLGFDRNEVTTQIDAMEWFSEFGSTMRNANRMLSGFCKDIWEHISRRHLGQVPEEGATGSSAMPQKVNPLRFENAEANFEIAGDSWDFMGWRQGHSRMERDLSGSTVLRNIGYAAALQLVAFSNLDRGLGRIYPNELVLSQELDEHPEILAEGVQTTMRINSQTADAPDSYGVVKELTRGKDITKAHFELFVDALALPDDEKFRLKSMTTRNYLGRSAAHAQLPAIKLGLVDAEGNLIKK